ncbi:TIGR03364 family FAD-dependent oxidoreductase [Pseudonocardia sp. TRM90224]|uniref:TIGR03364 family FAD-dependent oxidoreductase n=1 Tax=Pseudonocardia sp. TRM90224 TaxID=2812678 RepID=UPI001E3FDB00|nr:TIGR03364 family FAD-dependent oxidoreductase [Pseudonocardia sp. TRM90224]
MSTDLVVVGAGIVGLAHAVDAVARGMSVTVVERDERAVGASVRNFGHGCLTAQVGDAYAFGGRARGTWLRLAREAGFWAAESGTLAVARSAEEMACINELGELRGADEVVALSAAEVAERVPVATAGLHGGAFLPRDIRLDPRAAAPAIAAWLADQPGVRMLWSTTVTGVESGGVRTPRGDIAGRNVVVCAGHDLDRLLPATAEEAGMRRCGLQMMQVRAPGGITVPPAVLTGSSLLRYPAFSATAGAAALRKRWAEERPEMLDAGINHMLTQRPDGDLVVGDTHTYARTLDPLRSESLDELLLAETAALLGVDELRVVHRWQGVYASAPDAEFLRTTVAPGVTAVAVTAGIGMTTAFGLAPDVLDTL